jgi:hypothetical protein
MFKIALILISCLATLSMASAQEVVIKDFPLGVGGSVDKGMFQTYLTELRALADTLQKYPLARAIITGGADGNEYRESHDAKNPGLALGRAHLLRSLLMKEFGVDSAQLIIQSEDVAMRGGEHRFAGVRIDRTLSDLDARMNAIEKRPPMERHFTEIKEADNPLENLGILFGIGGSSSPYGGVPTVSTALTFGHVIYVEAFVGHTFWDGSYRWQDQNLDTKRRLIGGQLVVFPDESIPLGIVGGWVRAEQISQQHYEYVRMSEGPMLGLRFMPVNYLSVTGVYNPVKQRISGRELSASDNDNLQISAALHLAIGGAK